MSWYTPTILKHLHESLPEYHWELTPCDDGILIIEGSVANAKTYAVSRLKFTYNRRSDRVVHVGIKNTDLHNCQAEGIQITSPVSLDRLLLTIHNAGVARLAQASDICQAMKVLIKTLSV